MKIGPFVLDSFDFAFAVVGLAIGLALGSL